MGVDCTSSMLSHSNASTTGKMTHKLSGIASKPELRNAWMTLPQTKSKILQATFIKKFTNLGRVTSGGKAHNKALYSHRGKPLETAKMKTNGKNKELLVITALESSKKALGFKEKVQNYEWNVINF